MPTKAIDKELVIQEVVAKLKHFAKLYGVRSIFVVGGYCRERYSGTLWKVNDIDVASAYHEQARQLGGLFASEILNSVPKFYARTGTASMEYPSEFGSIRVEFQGDSINAHMHNQEVRSCMQKQGIEDVPLMNNIYGRDFTINALVYSLHNEMMFDPTEKAIEDFDKKRIAPLLPAPILIKYNPLAAIRAVRFAITYDFRIVPELRSAIIEGGTDNLRSSLSEERIVKEIVKTLHVDATKGLEMLRKLELDRILLHPDVKEYIYLGTKDKKHVED